MQKIVAIGGGSIGWGTVKPEVTPISREIIRLSGKRFPRLLFIPTASLDDPAYVRTVQSHFGGKFHCRIDVLTLIKNPPPKAGIRRKILGADIIYVGGGNTLRMVNCWKKLEVDKGLEEARRRGKVLCGTSAGAICWFRQGNSDSRKFRNPKAKLIKVTGLDFIDALACPHYDAEKDRKPELKEMMRKTPGVALALDNCAALEVEGKKARVITSKPGAGVYKVFWQGGSYFCEAMPKGKWMTLERFCSKARG